MVEAAMLTKSDAGPLLQPAIEAASLCAPYYKYGRVVQKDLQKALQFMHWAALHGNEKSLLHMAHWYEDSRFADGKQIKEHQALSLAIYQKLAKNQNVEALNDLARCYSEGIGMLPDPKKAFEFFHKAHLASQGGDPNVLLNLAKCYLGGEGTPFSLQMGIQLVKKAAKIHAKRGEIALAMKLLSNFAHDWMAEKTHPWHEGAVGLLLLAVSLGESADFSKDAELPDVFSPLAYCYFTGLGLAQADHNKGISILRAAIDHGLLDAKTNLGWWQIHRLKSDHSEAYQLNEQAAMAGSSLARINRAWYHLLGCGGR